MRSARAAAWVLFPNWSSQSNFVLVRVGVDDGALAQALAEEDGLLVRTGSEYGLDGYVRITVGPEPLMERVAGAIGRLIAADSARATSARSRPGA